ncbi:hypothetical protein PHYPSEUDO_002552 [Phytophthora pseudosyringae]|uniref:SelT-like protein n=1 Tax=Phytophthora pseudosyringae TaxID=221518 RepID=A0A8T1VX79_9STRA|nr:hypothetical protein PHYPSEUDO_002552 [Phytophthora pseudosyringae]
MTSRALLLLLLVALSLAVLASHGAPAESVFDAAAKAEEAAAAKERNLQRSLVDDQVRVAYCTACGYQQNFQQIKTYVEDTFPHLVDRVDGVNYEVDPYKMMLAQFLGYAQATAMILLLFGEYILPALGVDATMLRWARDNRLATFLVVVLMGTAASSLTASGAFEIYFNGDLIFSKLETGRWPTLLGAKSEEGAHISAVHSFSKCYVDIRTPATYFVPPYTSRTGPELSVTPGVSGCILTGTAAISGGGEPARAYASELCRLCASPWPVQHSKPRSPQQHLEQG